MTVFVSPLADLAGWALSPVARVELPKPLRYGGAICRGVRAERPDAVDVLTPAPGVFRKSAAEGVVELQVNPFGMRDIVGALSAGLPTFYFLFDTSVSVDLDDDQYDSEGAVIATASGVTIAMVGQDRIVRDPALWTREIAAALPAGDATAGSWRAFADAVEGALDAPTVRPILVLDHSGQPMENAAFDLAFGATTLQNVALSPGDGGDLRAALRRLNLPNDPFAGGTSVTLGSAIGDTQFAGLGGALSQNGQIVLSATDTHVQVTDLHSWFAPQFANPDILQAARLRRYSRGNRMTPFINGRPYYKKFFELLRGVNGTGQGVHLTGGFLLEATEKLLELPDGDPNPATLEDALKAIAPHFPRLEDGGGRFLSAKFIQIQDEQTLTTKEIVLFYSLVGLIGLVNLAKLRIDALKTDFSGFLLLTGAAVGQHLLINDFLEQDGKPLEPMRDAVETLTHDALKSVNRFSALPTTIADNPLAPSGYPFGTLFPFIERFGLYHQKIAVIKNGQGLFGFCGGIDLSTNRLDDADHNVAGPYHDVHAMVEGEAAIDVATTFEQRWDRDGFNDNGTKLPLAFEHNVAPAEAIGEDIVQMARTYPSVRDTARALEFAPKGDRTIFDTTMNAIHAAKEYIHIEDQYFTPPPDYVDAIVDRIANGGLRKLIVTLPTKSDQPFGDTSQTETLEAFRQAEVDAGAAPGEIVKVGILRRHFTTPSSPLRAASGKLILQEHIGDAVNDTGFDDAVVLGPETRLPPPPFWLAIEGELMWVYDEAPAVGVPLENAKRYLVDRGQRTRLFGLGTEMSARPRRHEKGAAATVVDLKGIFVHAKVILIDDVFAGIGSANVNRRGFFSDGEGHFFWMPERLRTKPPGTPIAQNPIAALRYELWAELLNLPHPMAAPLLDDPVAAAALFDRLPIFGNRFVPKDAIPQSLSTGGFSPGDTVIFNLLKALFTATVQYRSKEIFEGVSDPTTSLEPTV